MAEKRSPMEMLGDITVDTDNSRDLGATTKRWKDLYLAGNLKDDTNTVTIANIQTALSFSRRFLLMGS